MPDTGGTTLAGAAGFYGPPDGQTVPVAAQPAPSPIGPKPGGIYRIGVITYASLGIETPLKRELSRLGYVEGETVVYKGRAGNRDIAAMDQAAAELVAWKPDVIMSLMTMPISPSRKRRRETRSRSSCGRPIRCSQA